MITANTYNAINSSEWNNTQAILLNECRNLSNKAIKPNTPVLIVGKTKNYFFQKTPLNQHRFDVLDPTTNTVVSGIKCTELKIVSL